MNGSIYVQGNINGSPKAYFTVLMKQLLSPPCIISWACIVAKSIIVTDKFSVHNVTMFTMLSTMLCC